jgi:hypothetical protein
MVARERFARIWVTSLYVMSMLYVMAHVGLAQFRIEPTVLQRFGLLAAALGGLGVIAIVAWLVVRDRTGEGVDERDRLILARSSAVGYYLLLAGMMFVGCYLPFVADTWDIVHAAVASIIVTEIVTGTLLLRGYQRGLA